jgi:NCS2 family nucleobase:cation symporter-2
MNVAEKPADLLYGENDRPPWAVLAFLSLQHVFVMSSTLVLPVVLVAEIGGGAGEMQATVAMTMIACGLGTFIQALRWRGIGSGYLCPNLCGPNFFAASMGAAWLGGLPLMRGMTIAAGVVEIVFARLLRRLAFLFPTEITGLVVFMVAFGLVPLGASKFLGINYTGDPILPRSFVIAAVTLLVMVGVNVWGSGKLKLYGVLVGMATGYSLSIAAGLLTAADFSTVAEAPWLGLPHYADMWRFSFRWSLLPAFVIVSICGALKSFGNLVLCEKVNDRNWSAPDIGRAGDGLVADGLTVVASGLLGGVASDTSASNVALSSASGATSRWIGFGAGLLFVVLGLSPKLSAILSVMPASVAGAILVFVVCFMMMSGVQIILSSHADVPKIFVMGVALTFGISLDILPSLYAHVFAWLRPLLESSLTLSTVVAVVLNQLLRLGRKPGVASGTTAIGEG